MLFFCDYVTIFALRLSRWDFVLFLEFEKGSGPSSAVSILARFSLLTPNFNTSRHICGVRVSQESLWIDTLFEKGDNLCSGDWIASPVTKVSKWLCKRPVEHFNVTIYFLLMHEEYWQYSFESNFKLHCTRLVYYLFKQCWWQVTRTNTLLLQYIIVYMFIHTKCVCM